MDRLRNAIRPRQSYEPLEGGSIDQNGEVIEEPEGPKLSWIEYYIFLLLGVSMLWAW